MELRPTVSPTTLSLQLSPSEIGARNCTAGEKAASEIIRKVQPTSASEEKRREVIEYIQNLIRNCLGAELFPYGSVPLKTFLPDGDIDLTAFGGSNVEDSLADIILSVLEEEEKSGCAEFVVKDVQLIRAEVKIVKCIIQNIVVDVSVNQIGGLSTLCFLEQIDRLIGKDHLFKRSIILIKAWCYYESRILGAHHGLISTYGLETLVLYIFNLFHSSLDGPLAVLYKFLDYFSKFDWETYCISLNGPVRLSSLPAMEAEMPEDCEGDLLLTRDFLISCVDMFSVPSRGGDQMSRAFQRKHLNIVDPLRESNNLGRSVSKGNFYRVRSAFSYGARKLAKILAQSENSIASELQKFFSNTIARHGGGQRPDVRDLEHTLSFNRSITTTLVSEPESCKNDALMNGYHDTHNIANGEEDCSSVSTHPNVLQNNNQPPNPMGLNYRFHGDANDLATSGIGGLKISIDSSRNQTPVIPESVSAVGGPYHLPHLFFANSKFRNADNVENNTCYNRSVTSGGNTDETHLVHNDDQVLSPSKLKNIFHAPNYERDSSSGSDKIESLNDFSNLVGDYDSYFQYLQYGRWCYEHAVDMQSLHAPPSTPPQQNNYPLSQFRRNGLVNRLHNGFHPGPAIYSMQPVFVPGVTFGWDSIPKARGTGTYFPSMNQPPSGYRPSAIEGRNQAQPRSSHNHGRNAIFKEASSLDRSHQEALQPQVSMDQNLVVGSSDSYRPFSIRGNGCTNANISIIQPEGIECGFVGHPSGTVMMEKNRQRVSSSPRTSPGTPRSPPAFSKDKDRISLRSSYRLKDEDDFPRLSV